MLMNASAYLLHGDLHLRNIISHGEQWMMIDPKGVIGPIEFEVAWFNFILDNELQNSNDMRGVFWERLGLLSRQLNLVPEVLTDWVYVRWVLAALWMVEDGEDPRVYIQQLKTIFT